MRDSRGLCSKQAKCNASGVEIKELGRLGTVNLRINIFGNLMRLSIECQSASTGACVG